MFCYNCGKEIDDKAVICVHCGVPVKPIAKIIQVTNGNNKMWQHYVNFWKINYSNYYDEATREEYWSVFLFNVLFSLASAILVIACPFYLLATIIPSICIGIRRLHDTGRSGHYMWFNLIPLVGSIFLIVLFCQPSTIPYKGDIDKKKPIKEAIKL
jgi:uncharacterized membrane protein YhaH (DUF805 family)